jgi:hypothetical protein
MLMYRSVFRYRIAKLSTGNKELGLYWHYISVFNCCKYLQGGKRNQILLSIMSSINTFSAQRSVQKL